MPHASTPDTDPAPGASPAGGTDRTDGNRTWSDHAVGDGNSIDRLIAEIAEGNTPDTARVVDAAFGHATTGQRRGVHHAVAGGDAWSLALAVAARNITGKDGPARILTAGRQRLRRLPCPPPPPTAELEAELVAATAGLSEDERTSVCEDLAQLAWPAGELWAVASHSPDPELLAALADTIPESVARNDDIDAATASRLASHDDPEVREALARNPRWGPVWADRLVRDPDAAVRSTAAALASEQAVDAAGRLVWDDALAANLASNPTWPAGRLAEIAERAVAGGRDWDYVLARIVARPDCPELLIRTLADHAPSVTARWLAGCQDPDILEHALGHPDPSVRAAAATNPNVPAGALRTATKTGKVRFPAWLWRSECGDRERADALARAVDAEAGSDRRPADSQAWHVARAVASATGSDRLASRVLALARGRWPDVTVALCANRRLGDKVRDDAFDAVLDDQEAASTALTAWSFEGCASLSVEALCALERPGWTELDMVCLALHDNPDPDLARRVARIATARRHTDIAVAVAALCELEPGCWPEHPAVRAVRSAAKAARAGVAPARPARKACDLPGVGALPFELDPIAAALVERLDGARIGHGAGGLEIKVMRTGAELAANAETMSNCTRDYLDGAAAGDVILVALDRDDGTRAYNASFSLQGGRFELDEMNTPANRGGVPDPIRRQLESWRAGRAPKTVDAQPGGGAADAPGPKLTACEKTAGRTGRRRQHRTA